ncbi:MAG: glycosyltransferase family 4 protein [Bacteroidia bacterium]|nr:glycosyltransferase family 4 protein [Bacteroidia bacterium]
MSQQNILILCTRVPWPPKDGGSLAMLNMIRAYHKAGLQVTVMCMNTSRHYVQLKTLPADIRQHAEFYAVEVNTDVRTRDMLANFIFSKTSYHVQRFTSKPFRIELENLLRKKSFDFVQLETLYMAPYIQQIRAGQPDALIVFRAHNVEHEIWERRAANMDNPLKKYFLDETAFRIKAYEESVLKAGLFDVMVPISGRDEENLKKLGATKPSYVCPAGIDFDTVADQAAEVEFPSVFYLGALDWTPNAEGLDWFLAQVWPRIHSHYPKVPLYIAGRNMPARYSTFTRQQITALGEIDDVAELYQQKAIMIAPILSGSGIRVKILEGMAYGKPIVATSMAAEGIGLTHGDQIMIGDTPDAFANAVSVLIEHPDLCDTIGAHARQFARSRFDSTALTQKLLDYLRKQLAAKRGG